MKRENEFDKLLLKSIDNSLKEVLTENATSAIYAYLESNYALSQEEIPEKLDVFVDGLHKFLNKGAFAIERVILENLCSNIECKCQCQTERNHDFKNSVIQIKSSLKMK